MDKYLPRGMHCHCNSVFPRATHTDQCHIPIHKGACQLPSFTLENTLMLDVQAWLGSRTFAVSLLMKGRYGGSKSQ